MSRQDGFDLRPIGVVRSTLEQRAGAPRQAWLGAPPARLEIHATYARSLEGVEAGDEIWVLTWLHESDRMIQQVHPQDDASRPLTGVFATRSQDRPNPIGLHRARVEAVDGCTIVVDAIEAIDGTPIVDVKPVLREE